MPALNWTQEQEDQLRRLWPRSTTADVARAMGKTARAVTMRAHRLGLRRDYETTGYVHMGIKMPAAMRDKLQAEADLRAVTIGSIIREVLAAHLGLAPGKAIATKGGHGGPRSGAGRKPRHKLVNNQFVPSKPSMPFVNIRSD